MIDVELSNIWGSVSLPDLLSGEKDLFDAHMQLRTNMLDGPDFLGWLNAPEGVMARAVLSIGKAAEKIAELGETLVIVGSGDAPLAAQAAIRALGKEGRVRLAFAGTSLSPNAYEQLCSGLEGQDFCLLLIAQTAVDMECGVASRAVRWLLDRRYGPEARQHIFVCAPKGSLLHVMAQEEGYIFLAQPAQLGCADSALSPATLLPMAAAGIEPLSVLEGAGQAYHDYDLRAFENPVWMYAGARHALELRARRTEFLGIFEPDCMALGRWWAAVRSGAAAAAATVCCPSRRNFPARSIRLMPCWMAAAARLKRFCGSRCPQNGATLNSTGRITTILAISPDIRSARRRVRCSTHSCSPMPRSISR